MTLNFTKMLGLSAAIITLSVGGAFAATNLSSDVNLMSGPGDHFKVLTQLKAGDSVTVSRQSGEWCRINAPQAGWIPCSDADNPSRVNFAAPTSSGAAWTTPIYNPLDDPAVATRNAPND